MKASILPVSEMHFYFHATKVFNTIEGGAVCYKDDRMGSVLNN